MQAPVVIIGLGEMGSVFARAFLKNGYPVYPVTRQMDMHEQANIIPQPALVLVAVAEKDIQPVLKILPDAWKDRLALLQNELLPRDWQAHNLESPTVISVWFEKKPGQEPKVLIPSPVFGPAADAFVSSLASINIPARKLDNDAELEYELVLKNVYILTTNISGLVTGGTVSELWKDNEQLARDVASDVMDIQEWLTGKTFDRDRLIDGMLEAFDGDPEHKCMGRSAPARLDRALNIANEADLDVPTLRQIQKENS